MLNRSVVLIIVRISWVLFYGFPILEAEPNILIYQYNGISTSYLLNIIASI